MGLTDEESEKATQLYRDGLTLAEIAAQYGVAASTVWSCLLRQGLQLRPAARCRVAAS